MRGVKGLGLTKPTEGIQSGFKVILSELDARQIQLGLACDRLGRWSISPRGSIGLRTNDHMIRPRKVRVVILRPIRRLCRSVMRHVGRLFVMEMSEK